MKKQKMLVLTSFILVLVLILGACGQQTTTPTTQPTTTAPTTPGTTTPTVTTPAPVEPKYGGTLKMAYPATPTNVGYFPGSVFSDTASWYFFAETLLTIDGDGKLIPLLAESYDVDVVNHTITWHLRQGVKFHDGTDFDAEAVLWTFQKTLDAGTLLHYTHIQSIEVVNKYTLRFNLSQFNLQMLTYFGTQVFFFSPTTTEANGESCARQNAVGTGPFILDSWSRDNYMSLIKNENYWMEGRPYLDRIAVYIIPDTITGAIAFEKRR